MIEVEFTFMSEGQLVAVDDVIEERGRQEDQWGDQNHHPAYWLAILGKQVGQFGSTVLDREWESPDHTGVSADMKMRHEAVQVAAVALKIIEVIDKGNMPVGIVTAKPADPRQLAKALGRGDESLPYDQEDDEGTIPGIGEPGSEPCS